MHRYSWYLAATVWLLWGIGVAMFVEAHVFETGWPIAPTMLVGSFIAGSTSAGGGAVAFPVMTLVFKIEPNIARDFALMIQSVGMGAASIGIVLMGIRVDWRAVILSNLGGLVGIGIGFQISASWPPAYTKMFFVSLWASIALALYLINRTGRTVTDKITNYDLKKALAVLGIGVVGGFVSGMTGSGLDILTFAVLTMAFRLCESIATPTSVVIMAVNSILGVAIRWSMVGINESALTYWWCAVPVVVVGAPLGAWYIKNKSRHFITTLLYISITVQFVAALLIVKQSRETLLLSLCVIIAGSSLFLGMNLFAKRASDQQSLDR